MKLISKLNVARYQYYYKGDYEKSLEAVEEFLERKPNHKRALKLKGNVNAILGRLPEAIKSYKRALLLCNPIRNFWERCYLLESIGKAYWELKEPELAIKYLEEVMGGFKTYYRWGKEAFDEPMILMLLTIGDYQAKSSKLSDAIVTYEKALQFYSNHGPLEGIADVFYELGVVYYQQNDLTKALAKFLKVLNIYKSTSDLVFCGYCSYYIGCILFMKKNFKESLVRINSSIVFLGAIYKIYYGEGEGKAEDEPFYRRAVKLRDSLLKNGF